MSCRRQSALAALASGPARHLSQLHQAQLLLGLLLRDCARRCCRNCRVHRNFIGVAEMPEGPQPTKHLAEAGLS